MVALKVWLWEVATGRLETKVIIEIGCHHYLYHPMISNHMLYLEFHCTNLVSVKVSHSGEDSLTCASWAPDGRRLAVVRKDILHNSLFVE